MVRAALGQRLVHGTGFYRRIAQGGESMFYSASCSAAFRCEMALRARNWQHLVTFKGALLGGQLLGECHWILWCPECWVTPFWRRANGGFFVEDVQQQCERARVGRFVVAWWLKIHDLDGRLRR